MTYIISIKNALSIKKAFGIIIYKRAFSIRKYIFMVYISV